MDLICIAALFLFSDVCQYQPYSDMPLMVTAYNPFDGGINCNDDCGMFATGVKVSRGHLGHAAACPTEWVRLDKTAVVTIQDNDYFCLDNFGSVDNRHPVYWRGQWYLRVDLVLENPHEWGVRIVDDWSMRWD